MTRFEVTVLSVAEGWRQQNGLPATPLSFAAHEGNHLCTRQCVGVVEVNDVVIEIYPKLDATLIDADEQKRLPHQRRSIR